MSASSASILRLAIAARIAAQSRPISSSRARKGSDQMTRWATMSIAGTSITASFSTSVRSATLIGSGTFGSCPRKKLRNTLS